MTNTTSLDIDKLTELVAKADPSISVGEIKVQGNVNGNIVVGNRNVIGDNNVIYEINTDNGAVVNLYTAPLEKTKRTVDHDHPPVRRPRSFVGRKQELETLDRYIRDGEAVLLHGHSGVGKTTLVQEVAYSDAAKNMPDGVIYLEQPYEGNIPSLQDTLQRVFDKLFITNPPIKLTDSIVEADLAETRPLLIFDEVGLPQDASNRLPTLFPHGAVLVTSQDAPNDDVFEDIRVATLNHEETVQLFIEKSKIKVNKSEHLVIDQICKILEDVPLAVVMVANAIRHERYPKDGLGFLHGLVEYLGRLDPQSQDKFQAAIERSYKLLRDFNYHVPRESYLIVDVVGAPGKSIDRELLENVWDGAESAVKALEDLEVLYANSSRMRMPDGLREVLLSLADKIHTKPEDWLKTLETELEDAREGLLHYLIVELKEKDRYLDFDFVSDNLGDILGILQWAFDKRRWNDVIELGKAVDPYLTLHGLWDAWSDVLNQVQIAGRNTKDPKLQASVQAWVFHQLGTKEIGVGNRTRAISLLRRALMMRVSQGDIYGAAHTLHNLRILTLPPSPPKSDPDLDPKPKPNPSTPKPTPLRPWPVVLFAGGLVGLAILIGVLLPPALKLTNQASPTKYHLGGQVIEYSYIIDNAGLKPIPGPIFVTDDKVQVRCPDLETIGNEDGSLDWNETITCSGFYSINDDDIEIGSLTNNATANIKVDVGQKPIKSKPQTVTISYDSNYLMLSMQASTTTYRDSGETVTIAYNISNNGTATLGGPVTVTGDNVQVNCPDLPKSNDLDGFLSVSESLTCTSTYTITDADVTNGYVTITARASAGEIDSEPQSFKIFKLPQSDLMLSASSDRSTYTKIGEQINFTYVIRNSGNTTLGPAQFTVSDSLIGTAPINCGVADTILTTEAMVTCNATYTITEADLNLESITNYATASGGGVVPSQSASTTINKSISSELSNTVEMTVQADAPIPVNTVGQIIQYTYNIKNTGTVPLPGVVSITGATVLCPPVNAIGNLNEFLDPNETLTCVSSYTVLQADLDAGSLTSVTTATVNGILSNAVTTTVLTVPNRILTLTKSASPLVYENAGQTIKYTYVITNRGTLDIGPVQFTVADDRIGTPFTCGNADTTLAPNTTVTCSAIYTITEADVEHGSITNTAVAYGGQIISKPWSVTIHFRTEPSSLSLKKLAEPDTYQKIGQKVRYIYFVTNDGKYPLKGSLTIKDDKASVYCPEINTTGDGDGVLNPGELLTCTADYTITDLDIRHGSVTNTAVATMDGVESNPDSVTIIEKVLVLKKSADHDTYRAAGEIVTYMYEVTSQSGVPLVGPVIVADNKLLVKCQNVHEVGNSDELIDRNETITCTGQYVITQADIDAILPDGDHGSVTNTAIASAGGISSDPAAVTITAIPERALTLAMKADPTEFDTVDQRITYTYVVTNAGNLTNTSPIQITDDHIDNDTPFVCDTANKELAPSESVTCTASYTIVQADFELDSVTNTAIAFDDLTKSLPATTTVSCLYPPSDWKRYIIENGETLAHISTWFDNTTEGDLRKKNCMGLSTTIIQGQPLYVPGNPPPKPTILVTIKDRTGTPLINTPVTLINVNTGSSQTVFTGGNGSYTFSNLEPGIYRIFQTQSTLLRRGDHWVQNFVIVPVQP